MFVKRLTLYPRKDVSAFTKLVGAEGESACLAEVGKVGSVQGG